MVFLIFLIRLSLGQEIIGLSMPDKITGLCRLGTISPGLGTIGQILLGLP